MIITPELKANFLALQNLLHGNSFAAGWWNDSDMEFNEHGQRKMTSPYIIATKFALIHSEVTEAMEGFRQDKMDDKLPHRSMVETELADVLIRVLDLAGALNLDLIGAVEEKNKFNATRPDHKLENRAKKGGKKF